MTTHDKLKEWYTWISIILWQRYRKKWSPEKILSKSDHRSK